MGSQEEESETTLQEEIKILQEQGLSPEKVAEQILQEDFNADINILSEELHLDKMVIGRIKGRLSRLRKRHEAKAGKQEPSQEESKEAPIYKGETDTTVILKDILVHHPDIPAKVVDEVLSWAEFGPIHPTQLISLLQSFRGVTATTAYIVSQKYNLALQKAQQEGRLNLLPFVGGPVPGGPGTTPFPGGGFSGAASSPPIPGTPQVPQTTSTPTGWGNYPSNWPGYPPSPVTEEKIRNIIREERAAATREQPKEAEQYVELEEPVRDEKGNVIVTNDDRPVMKKMRVPVNQADRFMPRDDHEARFLEKLAKYRELFPTEKITTDQIREIIREEMPGNQPATPQEKPITIEEVRKASTEAAQTVATNILEAHAKEDKEDARFRRLEEAVRSSASARNVEGYKEDSMRLMGQGIAEAAGVAREKKPLEMAAKLIFGGEASPKEVEPGAATGLLNRLKSRGWVAEQ